MKQIIAFLVFWISFLSCQSEEINIYTQHVKEISKNKDGWNLVWSEEFEQKVTFRIPKAGHWQLKRLLLGIAICPKATTKLM